jgi:four helix bundle protein
MVNGEVMAEIRSHKDLDAWQMAVTLASECYSVTASFPREEAFGQTAQIRRASVSIAANIAEGLGRESTASSIHFLRIAQGSQKDLETHMIIAERVGLLDAERCEPPSQRTEGIGRMLRNLIRSLEARRSG